MPLSATEPPDYEPLVINLDVGLADLLETASEELAKITGVDDYGAVVSHLPSEATSSPFLFNLGTLATIDLKLPAETSVGTALHELALFVKNDYLAKPEQFESGGKRLEDIRILQLVWWPSPDDRFWQVVTNAEREV